MIVSGLAPETQVSEQPPLFTEHKLFAVAGIQQRIQELKSINDSQWNPVGLDMKRTEKYN